MTSGDADALSRFSLNQMTVDRWSLDEAIEACARAEVRWMAPGRDLRVGRRIVAEGVERLLPHAIDHGVRLAIEPLHPMMVAERSVIVSGRRSIWQSGSTRTRSG